MKFSGTSPICPPDRFSLAIAKIKPRFPEFQRLGWTRADLTCCARVPYGHHGLALFLGPEQDLGQIWEWCVEILGSIAGNHQRSRLTYWRTAPMCQLVATVGAHIVPPELRQEWRVAKL